MSSPVEVIGALGSELVRAALLIGTFAAVVWSGLHFGKKTKKAWIGYAAAAITFLTFVIIFGPTIEALKEMACRGSSDYQACLNDGGGYEP